MFLHALLEHGLICLVQQDPVAHGVTPRRVVVVREDVLLTVMPLLVVVVGVVIVVDVMVGDGGTVVGVVLHCVGGRLVPGGEAEHSTHLAVRFDHGPFSVKEPAKNRA